MKSEDEVRQALDVIAEQSESLDWMGDNFKYGFWCGKVDALSWVLDEVAGSSVSINHDFETYREQMREIAAKLRERLRGEGNDE